MEYFSLISVHVLLLPARETNLLSSSNKNILIKFEELPLLKIFSII